MSFLRLPRLNYIFVRNFLLLVLLSASIFTLGYQLGFKGYKVEAAKLPKVTISREIPVDKKDLDFNLFWRVWDTMHSKYFDKQKLVESEMIYGAIRGMVAAVGDPYTVYLPPSENKVVQEDLLGSFQGVGIQIGFKGTQLAVIAPLPKSPAEKAGIKAGDLIVGITDESKGIERGTVGITLPEAVQIIRGPAGTKVSLTLIREDSSEPLNIDVVRESIDVPSVVVDYLEGEKKIAHVKVLKFAGETLGEWEKAVIELLKNRDLTSIVLDLRNNPGGYLDDAIELASGFLDTGEIVVIEEDGGGARNEYRVQKLGRLRDPKVVVLVNAGSASASEILAGALKDNDRAELVGDLTFGKGTIQESMQIDGEGGIHITIARWLTPSGEWVNEKGLKPDVELEDNPETPEDEQLQKAIELVK